MPTSVNSFTDYSATTTGESTANLNSRKLTAAIISLSSKAIITSTMPCSRKQYFRSSDNYYNSNKPQKVYYFTFSKVKKRKKRTCLA